MAWMDDGCHIHGRTNSPDLVERQSFTHFIWNCFFNLFLELHLFLTYLCPASVMFGQIKRGSVEVICFNSIISALLIHIYYILCVLNIFKNICLLSSNCSFVIHIISFCIGLEPSYVHLCANC